MSPKSGKDIAGRHNPFVFSPPFVNRPHENPLQPKCQFRQHATASVPAPRAFDVFDRNRSRCAMCAGRRHRASARVECLNDIQQILKHPISKRL